MRLLCRFLGHRFKARLANDAGSGVVYVVDGCTRTRCWAYRNSRDLNLR